MTVTKELVTAGWDGASQPIIRFVADCGCVWNRDQTSLVRPCQGCLVQAAKDAGTLQVIVVGR